jgi:acetolactate synthase-1/3 small subunit
MTTDTKARRTITTLVEDRPGVLNRIASLFRRRGFNIASLAVGQSEQPGLSRMTIVVEAPLADIEQVTKQLRKVIEVVRVSDITEEDVVARELLLLKVKATPATRSEIIQIVDIFRANIVDVAPESVIIEATGDEQKIDAMIELLRGFGILEVMRTGRVAMIRGKLGPLGVAPPEEEHTHRERNGAEKPGSGLPGVQR